MKKIVWCIVVLSLFGLQGFAQESTSIDSVRVWQMRAEKNDVGAMINLFIYYSQQQNETEFYKYAQKLDEFIEEYNAIKIFLDVPYIIGLYYLTDDSSVTPKDITKGINYIKYAAENGCTDAQYQLGIIYHEGRYGQAKDLNESFKWSQIAAELGHSGAMLLLGMAYLNGDGVAENEKDGLRWITQSANLGNNMAAYYLGVFYFEAIEIKDVSKARYWLQKAIELGNEMAIQYKKEHGL